MKCRTKWLSKRARLKGRGKGRYAGLRQITFIHKLAAQRLEEYKLEAKSKGYNLGQEDPIFIKYNAEGKTEQIRIHLADKVFTVASLLAWHDLLKKRFSPHDVRDLTQSALESSGANSNIISPILAHKVKGVDSHYSAHFEDELLQVFKHALPWLVPTSKEEIKQETEDIKAKYDELEEKFVHQLAEKQRETLKAITEMLKLQGIKVSFEEG